MSDRMADVPPNIPIPAWLADRLWAAGGNEAPRYEASLYGPINSLLMWHFPVAQQFMIKPQALIRPEYINEILDDHNVELVRVSLDSYSGEVISRDEKGEEQSLKRPDFIVVKATPSLHNDQLLLVVEIKRQGVQLQSAKEQIAEYFGSLADKTCFGTDQPIFGSLDGLLILGKEAMKVSLAHPGGAVGFSRPYSITSGTIHNFLRSIAIAHL